MKVAKCCESKEPELLTFEQIKEREGVYRVHGDPYGDHARVIVIKGNIHLYFSEDRKSLTSYVEQDRYFRATNETLCVGLKDANGKWVE